MARGAPVPDLRRAAARRPRRRTALVAGLVAAVTLAAGCSVIPSGGGPQPASAPAPPPGAGPCCGLLVRPPQPGWSPQEVVKNFLLAGAIVADDFHVARQYLTEDASRSWQPGTEVVILTREPLVTEPPGRLTGPEAKPVVLVTGQEQARLSSTGQYIPASGGAQAPTEEFILQYVKGRYKIAELFSPGLSRNTHELLLTSDLFHLEYTPRNLYYYGLRSGRLLPYPVFVPIQGKNPAVALIDDLIKGPTGWLQGAARSAFPAGSRLVPPIQVFPGPSSGRTAIVNIAVPAHAHGVRVGLMATQLVATLTSPVYSPPLYRAVKIKINGKPWPPHRNGAALGLSVYQNDIPHLPAGLKAYYLSQGGVLRSLSPGSDRGTVVTNGPGAGQVTLTKIAVSPGGSRLAGLAGPANTVYTGDLVTTGPGRRPSLGQLHAQLHGTSFTSLSWDNSGDLWVVGRRGQRPGIWVLSHGQGPAVSVTPPPGLGPVSSLRVAPDGVRLAMIAGKRASAHLVLAAAVQDRGGFSLTAPAPIGSALPPVSALTWYDEDHLLVITGSGEGSRYWEVPVDGDNPTPLPKQPGMTTVTAAGPDNPIYLGLADNGLEKAAGLNQPLAPITPGQAVIYPG
jgi:hypothetical protein